MNINQVIARQPEDLTGNVQVITDHYVYKVAEVLYGIPGSEPYDTGDIAEQILGSRVITAPFSIPPNTQAVVARLIDNYTDTLDYAQQLMDEVC